MVKWRSVIQHAPAIAERDGGWVCRYCGVALAPTNRHGDPEYWDRSEDGWIALKPGFAKCQVDHLIARSKGGSNQLDNLVLACVWCNQHKGAKFEADYLEWLKDYQAWLKEYHER